MSLQKFAALLITVAFIMLSASISAYSQPEKAVVPAGITTSGVPVLPKAIQTELDSYSERVSSNFLGWTKDGTLFGYSQYYEPFLKKSPAASAPAIEINIDNPETVSLQPGSEKTKDYRMTAATRATKERTTAVLTYTLASSLAYSDA